MQAELLHSVAHFLQTVVLAVELVAVAWVDFFEGAFSLDQQVGAGVEDVNLSPDLVTLAVDLQSAEDRFSGVVFSAINLPMGVFALALGSLVVEAFPILPVERVVVEGTRTKNEIVEVADGDVAFQGGRSADGLS